MKAGDSNVTERTETRQLIMQLDFATADVFTTKRFHGNRVALVYGAEFLDDFEMQQVAAEFGYPESVFLNTQSGAKQPLIAKIFTPQTQVPFAGHPLVGAAFLIAKALARSNKMVEDLVFQVPAGVVAARIQVSNGSVVGAEVDAPSALAVGPQVSVSTAARLLGIGPQQVRTNRHQPHVVSVGLPVLLVEVSAETLSAVNPQADAHREVLPFAGADSVYAYSPLESGGTRGAVAARMFSLLDGIGEDPATGSAAAALAAFTLSLNQQTSLELIVQQGSFVNRESFLNARAWSAEIGTLASVGGYCRSIMLGKLRVR